MNKVFQFFITYNLIGIMPTTCGLLNEQTNIQSHITLQPEISNTTEYIANTPQNRRWDRYVHDICQYKALHNWGILAHRRSLAHRIHPLENTTAIKYLKYFHDNNYMPLENKEGLEKETTTIQNGINQEYPPIKNDLISWFLERCYIFENDNSSIKNYIRNNTWHEFALDNNNNTASYNNNTRHNLAAISNFIQHGTTIDSAQEGLPTLTDALKHVQNMYKIHLMPHSKDLLPTVHKILNRYENLNKENKHITGIKFRGDLYITNNDQVAFLMPLIVIYPVPDKQAAEKTLRWLLNTFKNQTGINIHPRFNKRVNSLIYYIQGNADDRFSPYNIYTNTFLNTEKLQNAAGNHNVEYNQLDLLKTQKLIDPETEKPFGESTDEINI